MHGLLIFAAGACQTLTGTDCSTGLPQSGASSGNLQHLIQIALGILAVVAVLIIVLGALSFVTTEGDPQKVSKARETIVYALIGLVIVVSAEVIVTFVLGKF